MELQKDQQSYYEQIIEDKNKNSRNEIEKELQKTFSDKTQIIRHDGSSKLEVINIIQSNNAAALSSQNTINGYEQTNQQSTINIQENTNLQPESISKQQVIRVKIEEHSQNKNKEQQFSILHTKQAQTQKSPANILNVNLDFGDQKFFGNVQQKKKLQQISNDRGNKLSSTINNENKKSITKTVSQNEEQELKKYGLLDIEESVRIIAAGNLQIQPIQGNRIQLQQRQGVSVDKLNQIIDELENKIIKNIDQNNQTQQKQSNKNSSKFYETQEIETQVKQVTPQSSSNELMDGLESLYSKHQFPNQPSIIVIGQKKSDKLKDDKLLKTQKLLQKSFDNDNRQLMSQFSKMMTDFKNGHQIATEEDLEKPSSAQMKISRIVKPLKLGQLIHDTQFEFKDEDINFSKSKYKNVSNDNLIFQSLNIINGPFSPQNILQKHQLSQTSKFFQSSTKQDVSIQDSQRIKELKNYKMDANLAKKLNKKLMLQGINYNMDFSNAFKKNENQQTLETNDVDERRSPVFGNSQDIFGPSNQRKQEKFSEVLSPNIEGDFINGLRNLNTLSSKEIQVQMSIEKQMLVDQYISLEKAKVLEDSQQNALKIRKFEQKQKQLKLFGDLDQSQQDTKRSSLMKSNGLRVIQKQFMSPSAVSKSQFDDFIDTSKLQEINFGNNSSLTNIIDYEKNKIHFSSKNPMKKPFLPYISKMENDEENVNQITQKIETKRKLDILSTTQLYQKFKQNQFQLRQSLPNPPRLRKKSNISKEIKIESQLLDQAIQPYKIYANQFQFENNQNLKKLEGEMKQLRYQNMVDYKKQAEQIEKFKSSFRNQYSYRQSQEFETGAQFKTKPIYDQESLQKNKDLINIYQQQIDLYTQSNQQKGRGLPELKKIQNLENEKLRKINNDSQITEIQSPQKQIGLVEHKNQKGRLNEDSQQSQVSIEKTKNFMQQQSQSLVCSTQMVSDAVANEYLHSSQIFNNQYSSNITINNSTYINQQETNVHSQYKQISSDLLSRKHLLEKSKVIHSNYNILPLQNDDVFKEQFNRISNMAFNLHDIKQQVRQQIFNKISNQQDPVLNEKSLQSTLMDVSNSQFYNQTSRKLSNEIRLDNISVNQRSPSNSPQKEVVDESQEMRQVNKELIINNFEKKFNQKIKVQKKKIKISQELRKTIRDTIQLLDRINDQKRQKVIDSKNSQIEFIRNVRNDYYSLKQETKRHIEECRLIIQSNIDQHVKVTQTINEKQDKFQFLKDYITFDSLQHVADCDEEFQDQLQTVDNQTKKFLNQIFNQQKSNLEFQNALKLKYHEYINQELKAYHQEAVKIQNEKNKMQNDIKSLQTQHHDENFVPNSLESINAHEEHLKRDKSLKIKKKFKHLVLKSVQQQAEKISFVDYTKNVKKKAIFVARTLSFKKAIQDLLKEVTVGIYYKLLSENLFQNEFIQNVQAIANIQKKLNNKASPVIQSAQQIKNEIDSYFEDSILKQSFYKIAKQGKLQNEDPYNIDQIMLSYFQQICNINEVPNPNTFAQPLMQQNVLQLSEMMISDGLASTIQSFLIQTKNISKCQVLSLVIDECQLTDENFEKILIGIFKQGNNIQKIHYQNNYLGPRSVRQLNLMLGGIQELSICNIKSVGGSGQISKNIIIDLIQSCSLQTKNLLKLKISKVDLNDNETIKQICEYIKDAQSTCHYDFSWTCLQPKHLLNIIKALMENPYKIKSLNFSYNSLFLQEKPEKDQKAKNVKGKINDVEQISISFIQNLIQFMKMQEMLNHLDLSGMRLEPAIIKQLAYAIIEAPVLMSLHLSDNNLYYDKEQKQAILDIFGLYDHDSEHLDELKQSFNQNQQISKLINVQASVKKFVFEMQQQEFKNKVPLLQDQNALAYKDQIIKQKIQKQINNNKLLNQKLGKSGISRTKDVSFDQFILTRKTNHPELIFNLNQELDQYFQIDSQQKWTFSNKNDCFICQKHKYVTIMYQQDIEADNSGLIEIKDKVFVEQLEKELNVNLKDILMQRIAPIIIGSVVSPDFKWKCRMLRSDLFSLLTVCQSYKFVQDKYYSSIIKKGVLNFADFGQKLIDEDQQVQEKLSGWNQILYSFLRQNQLYDIKTVNEPYDLENFQPSPGISFTYSAFVNSGTHQFLIYCPVTRRVFCQEITVSSNTVDFEFPEYPRMIQDIIKAAPTPNFWRNWIDDTNEVEVMIYMNDIGSGLYEPQKVVPDQEQLEDVHKFLKDNRKIFKTYFRELISKSLSFPRIKFDDILKSLQAQQITQEQKNQLSQAFIEVSFVSALRHQKHKSSNKGSLCRAEFFDFLIRCAVQAFPKNIVAGIKIFTDQYVLPYYKNSLIWSERALIRNNHKLNQFIIQNKELLEKLFVEYQLNGKGFTLIQAIKLINGLAADSFPKARKQKTQSLFDFIHLLPHDFQYFLPIENVQQCFVFSQMTIKNEQTQGSKYFYLLFVEFIEFLARISIKVYENNQKEIDQKFIELVEIIYERKRQKLKEGAQDIWQLQYIDSSSDDEIQQPKGSLMKLK